MDDLTKKAVGRLLERRMQAKYASRCPECGDYIEVGDAIVWEPGQKARHAACCDPPDEPDVDDSAEPGEAEEPRTSTASRPVFPQPTVRKQVDLDNPQDVLATMLASGGWEELTILRSGEAIVGGHHQDEDWAQCDSWVYLGAAIEDIARIARPLPSDRFTVRCVRCRKRWEARGWMGGNPGWFVDDEAEPLCAHVAGAKPGTLPLTIRQGWGAYDESGSRILCGNRAISRLIAF